MKITKEMMAKDLDYYQKEASILHCVLNDLVRGEVRWFRQGSQALGISRACGAAGALVIHQSITISTTGAKKVRSKYACAYFWEHWFPKLRDQSVHVNDKEGEDLRAIAFQAHNWILNQQNQTK